MLLLHHTIRSTLSFEPDTGLLLPDSGPEGQDQGQGHCQTANQGGKIVTVSLFSGDLPLSMTKSTTATTTTTTTATTVSTTAALKRKGTDKVVPSQPPVSVDFESKKKAEEYFFYGETLHNQKLHDQNDTDKDNDNDHITDSTSSDHVSASVSQEVMIPAATAAANTPDAKKRSASQAILSHIMNGNRDTEDQDDGADMTKDMDVEINTEQEQEQEEEDRAVEESNQCHHPRPSLSSQSYVVIADRSGRVCFVHLSTDTSPCSPSSSDAATTVSIVSNKGINITNNNNGSSEDNNDDSNDDINEKDTTCMEEEEKDVEVEKTDEGVVVTIPMDEEGGREDSGSGAMAASIPTPRKVFQSPPMGALADQVPVGTDLHPSPPPPPQSHLGGVSTISPPLPPPRRYVTAVTLVRIGTTDTDTDNGTDGNGDGLCLVTVCNTGDIMVYSAITSPATAPSSPCPSGIICFQKLGHSLITRRKKTRAVTRLKRSTISGRPGNSTNSSGSDQYLDLGTIATSQAMLSIAKDTQGHQALVVSGARPLLLCKPRNGLVQVLPLCLPELPYAGAGIHVSNYFRTGQTKGFSVLWREEKMDEGGNHNSFLINKLITLTCLLSGLRYIFYSHINNA